MTYKTALAAMASVLALAAAAPAGAVVLASSSFDTGAEGWTNGDFAGGGSTALIYDPAGWVASYDNYGYNAFMAPTAYLGDKSAAIGGALSFDVSDNEYDLNAQTATVTLYSAGLLLYGGLITIPDLTNFTHYSVLLKASNFYIGDPNALNGVQATDAQFAAVMGNLQRLAINGDYKTGNDYARLDNVTLTAAVPEPATWALMISGFGLAGSALRRRGTALSV